jgi:asparagine synthase (glutamine-hydrolysing)
MKNSFATLMGKIESDSIPYLKDTYNFKTRYEKLQNMLKARDIIDILKDTSVYITFSESNRLLKNRAKLLATNLDKRYLLNDQNDDINRMLALDYKTYMMDDVLTKVDRATMSVGLEGREPFLDYRLVEFIATLPSELKYKDGIKKYLLKEITHKYLPKEMMNRPKMGFGVPIHEWFKDELKEYFLHYLTYERLSKADIFDANEVIVLRDRYLNGETQNVDILWSLLMFEMWYEKWM